jgi:predicted ATP-dependent endonuclease of OLD family
MQLAMIITNIEITNFRSFGSNNRLILGQGLNPIVGENNVGKSSILRVLDILRKAYIFAQEDFPNGDTERKLLATINLELNSDELSELMKAIAKTAVPNKEYLISNFEALNKIQIIIDHSKSPEKQIRANFINLQKNPNQISFLSQYNEERYQSNLKDHLLVIFSNKVKIFDEVRKRPHGKNQNVRESLDGELVADVLANLKMGRNPNDRNKFTLIQEGFSNLFPNLKLDVVGEPGHAPSILIKKNSTSFEVTIDRAGTGIGEIIILLAHMIATQNMIFGLDMPELHLHPHAQRALMRLLEAYSKNNQFIIATHSSIFLDTKELERIIVIRDKQGVAKVSQLPDNYFNPEEQIKLARYLDTYNRDFFFSKSVLLVEGPTELGALPIFAMALKKDFDTYGIFPVLSGKYFGLFLKFVLALDSKYVVQCDKDALMNIEDSITVDNKKVRTSPTLSSLDVSGLLTNEDKRVVSEIERSIVIKIDDKGKDKYYYADEDFEQLKKLVSKYRVQVLPSDFEGVLVKNGYKDLIDKAERLSHSKVSCGKIVAEEIIEKKLPVPAEFVVTINSL